MSRIGKNLPSRINAHLKPLPDEFLQKISTRRQKNHMKHLWLEKIPINGRVSVPGSLSEYKRTIHPIEHNHTHMSSLVLKILFPGHLIEEMLKLKNMPEGTLEEKIAKENAFRNIILQQYHIREVTADKNCGLRAIINSLHPELDPNSEEITATILRGDVIEHVLNHPELFVEHNGAKAISDPKLLSASLHDYHVKMTTSEAPIGELEIKIMSEILETPIHVFSYQKPHIGAGNDILAGEDGTYGNHYTVEPILLYFDPVRTQYHPMEKLKR